MNDTPQLRFMSDLIEDNGKVLGENPYILYDEKEVSYAEFDRATCGAANFLVAQGAKPGDGLAILMGNCPEFLTGENG
ncbi:MAG: AMP-binding protein [Deltaproteobacteria bacterium]|nr:AMP-binding protein [Deltaproteobacteria bacterium]MBW2087064.1 AMP-binding protein [Deltaproteobacteria bacterium]